MKKLIGTFAIMLALSATSPAFAATNPYTDLPTDHWAYGSVIALSDAGIVTPYADGTFRGNQKASRFDMAAVFAALAERANLPRDAALMQPYTDLDDAALYRSSVEIVTRCGIMQGYGNKTFRGDNFITRLDLATMIYKYEHAFGMMENVDMGAPLFTDVPPDHWAYTPVMFAARNNIMSGYADGTFRGSQTITRYEVALIIAKLPHLAL